MKELFDVTQLDADDPFEIDDDNRPHLFKHVAQTSGRWIMLGPAEIYDIYVADAPLFYPARQGGQADWLMVGEMPSLILVVPLAPPRSGDPAQCRPIGIYPASQTVRDEYLRDSR